MDNENANTNNIHKTAIMIMKIITIWLLLLTGSLFEFCAIGTRVGELVGSWIVIIGNWDGAKVGYCVVIVGICDGSFTIWVGEMDGNNVENMVEIVGENEGWNTGSIVGDWDGYMVGIVGELVGLLIGWIVGELVGLTVGQSGEDPRPTPCRSREGAVPDCCACWLYECWEIDAV